MDLEAFTARLPELYGGDLHAPHPVERRFRALAEDVHGYATENKLALLNLAAAHLAPGEAYLEVGTWKGLSLIGAMLGNGRNRFYAMDNFLEFAPEPAATRAELFGNLRRWVDPGRLTFLEGDCFDLLRRPGAVPDPVGVYFFDGAHGRLPHYLALGAAEPLLADQALVVIDDASWPVVYRPTERYVRAHPGYRLLFDLRAERQEEPAWWNGVRVYAWRRPAGTPASRRLPPDVAWRLAAYQLAYRPFMRLAWKVVPGRPGLVALARLLSEPSRRVGSGR